ncbi:MAG: serine hydrolase, partial [Cellulomonadaceae bacterium]|nr:serine hydrolase [Cellulomonadaceae bacterium]
YGYIRDDNGNWRANIFSVPIIGGGDGGLFTCAADLDKLWRAVFANKVLPAEMTDQFLAPQVRMGKDEENSTAYGLGVYVKNTNDNPVYYAVGGDFGIEFFTAYFPKQRIVASALGNTELNSYPLLEAIITDLSSTQP